MISPFLTVQLFLGFVTVAGVLLSASQPLRSFPLNRLSGCTPGPMGSRFQSRSAMSNYLAIIGASQFLDAADLVSLRGEFP